MKRITFLSGLMLFAALTVWASTPKIGDPAPAFTLSSSAGASVSLKDYAGKKVVLVFYRGYW